MEDRDWFWLMVFIAVCNIASIFISIASIARAAG